LEYIFQKSWFCSISSLDDSELLAETTLMGTDIEALGRLVIDRYSFIIRDAYWEVNRSPGGMYNGSGILQGLNGVTAYFNSGGDLRREAGDIAGGLAREMMAECIRGVIQAETFLYRERGYPTPEAYGDYWEKSYLNSCRYYSNLHRICRRWSDYVGGYYTGEKLYARFKNCSILKASGGYGAAGIFNDSFHEMGICVNLNDQGVVLDCQGNFLRAPDPVCFENDAHLETLKGAVLSGFDKKEVITKIGGPFGCDHLADLVYDLAKGLRKVLNP
jgi:hypothetical protein